MSVTFSSDELAHLEETLHALVSPLAYRDVDSWRDLVLRRWAELLEADRAVFMMSIPDVEVESAHRLLGADESELVPYLTYYRHIDGALELIPKMKDGIATSTLLYALTPGGRAGAHNREVYTDYYSPHEVEDFAGIMVEPGLHPGRPIVHYALCSLAAYRSRYGTELFGDKGVAALRLLRPALLAGLETLQALARRRAELERAIDLVPEPVCLCRMDGEVLHRNPALTRLLAADPEAARLTRALTGAVRTLQALARRRRDNGAGAVASADLPTVRTRRALYRVRASLLEARASADPGMILVLQRFGAERPTPDALRRRFGLTRQQARVALLLAERWRNREIADHLSISPNTARRHTDRVLLKLGVRSRDRVEEAIRSPPG